MKSTSSSAMTSLPRWVDSEDSERAPNSSRHSPRMRESALEDLAGGEEGGGELGAQAPIEGDGHAGEEAGAVGREEASQLGDVFRAAEATDRDLRPVEVGV